MQRVHGRHVFVHKKYDCKRPSDGDHDAGDEEEAGVSARKAPEVSCL
jgi:hypothetical protein